MLREHDGYTGPFSEFARGLVTWTKRLDVTSLSFGLYHTLRS